MTTTLDIAWTAGFLEGEAWIGLPSKKKSLKLVVGQVNKEPLHKLQKLFGGSLYLQKKPQKNCQDCWYWTLTGAQAAALLMTVYVLMSQKLQARISLALGKWQLQRRWCNIPGWEGFNSKGVDKSQFPKH